MNSTVVTEGKNGNCRLPNKAIFQPENNELKEKPKVVIPPVKQKKEYSRKVKPINHITVRGQGITTIYSKEQIEELLVIGLEAFFAKYKVLGSAKTGAIKLYKRLSKVTKEVTKKEQSDSKIIPENTQAGKESADYYRGKVEVLEKLVSELMDIVRGVK